MDFIRLVTWLGIEGLARKRMWRLKNFMDFFFMIIFGTRIINQVLYF